MRTNHPLRIAFLLWLCFAASLRGFADKKIYVLSDIHVMAPSLLDSQENTAWKADLAENKKMQELSVPVFDLLVERIKADKPELLLIPGDLTKDAEYESHQYVVDKLAEIEAAGIRVFVIPGNHDRFNQEGARKYEGNGYSAVASMTQDDFQTYYKPYGYGDDSELHGSTLTYAVDLYPGLSLIGIDTGQFAIIDDDAVVWACQKAADARTRGQQVIVMMHHSLIPHFFNQESFHPLSVVRDNERIRDLLMEAGVKVVFTGHYHVSDITRYVNSQGQEIYDVCTGSTIAYPCDYRILSFDDQFSQLSITTSTVSSFPGFDEGDFPLYAKVRLQESVAVWAEKWLSNRMSNQLVLDAAAQFVTSAFVTHAEGNEPQNPNSAEALDQFKSAEDLAKIAAIFGKNSLLDTIEEVGLSIKSMLGDYPSEDDIDNVVDDRQLTITMPSVPSAIRQIKAVDAASDVWHTLQGVRLSSRPSAPGIYLHEGQKVVVK